MLSFNLEFKYPVSQILKIVKKNKENHQTIYNEAIINYKKILKQELQKLLNDVDNNIDIQHEIRIRKPQHFLNEYDQIIMMLEMTTNEEIHLTSDMFAKIVMNNWDWKNKFEMNTTVYANGNVGIGNVNPTAEFFRI